MYGEHRQSYDLESACQFSLNFSQRLVFSFYIFHKYSIISEQTSSLSNKLAQKLLSNKYISPEITRFSRRIQNDCISFFSETAWSFCCHFERCLQQPTAGPITLLERKCCGYNKAQGPNLYLMNGEKAILLFVVREHTAKHKKSNDQKKEQGNVKVLMIRWSQNTLGGQ
jgi:hypothetical protein